MADNETGFRNRDLTVEVITKPDADIKANIERTVLGVPGGMLYKIVDPTKRLDELIRPFFITLRKAGRLLGTACLAHRMVKDLDKIHNSYYIRYFSV